MGSSQARSRFVDMRTLHVRLRRLEGVLQSLYLLFNEGYNSASSDEVIRKDLIDESLRLTLMLSENPVTSLPQADALAALILFHAARLPGRIDASGNKLLLADQDRSLWDTSLIVRGFYHLNRSATGEEISTYHIEAAIAGIHSISPTRESTDWKQIVGLYDTLYIKNNSPVTALNRAIAIAELRGAEAGLEAINF